MTEESYFLKVKLTLYQVDGQASCLQLMMNSGEGEKLLGHGGWLDDYVINIDEAYAST